MDTHQLQRRVTNCLREKRIAAGLSQGALAQSAGITRQALYAMEKDQYLPGTEVALRLAHALGTSVEDLFSLHDGREILEAELLGDHSKGAKGTSRARGTREAGGVRGEHSTRVTLAMVGDRIMAKPVLELGDVLNYTVPADGLILGAIPQQRRQTGSGRSVYVQLLKSQKDVESQIIVAGCDPAIYLAGEHMRRQGGIASVVGWTMASLAALQALKRGDVHVAGIHMRDPGSGTYNLPFLKKYLRGRHVTVVRFAAWQEGLVVRRRKPQKVRGPEDLSRPDVRIVNREKGAGARLLLDHVLARHRIPSHAVNGYGTVASSQIGLGRSIAEGKADVGIGAQAVAHLYDLDFVPLEEERYDLVIPTTYLHSHPGMKTLLDTLTTRRFRQELEALGGYDAKESGKIIEDTPGFTAASF